MTDLQEPTSLDVPPDAGAPPEASPVTPASGDAVRVIVANRRQWRHVVLAVAATAVVVGLLAYGVFRGNFLAGLLLAIIAYVGLTTLVLYSTRRVKRVDGKGDTARRLIRICYVAGVVGGLCIARIGTNLGVRWVVLVALCGLHAVTVVSLFTLATQFNSSSFHSLGPWSVAVTAATTLGGAVGVYLVDHRPRCVEQTACAPLHEVFGLASWWYYSAIVVASLLALVATTNYQHRNLKSHQLVSVSATGAFATFAAGAVLVVATVTTTAWWRNRVDVAGPSLDGLPAITVTGDYVALGDSYSAGEGLHPFLAFTDSNPQVGGNGCHRSGSAYSQLLRFTGPGPALRFTACSGAVTGDLYSAITSPRDGGALRIASQVSEGVHPEVGLVTVTIGGNDVGFAKVVRYCFIHSDCTRSAPVDAREAQRLGLAEEATLNDWAAKELDEVVSSLSDLYPKLRASYPNARVLAIGYPHLFSDDTATIWGLSDCQTILRRFSPGERATISRLQDELTQRMHDTALVAGIEFVSPVAEWKGHEACGATGTQYTNSIKPFSISAASGLSAGDGGTFHPNAAGQRELAHLVTCYLTANGGARPPDAEGIAPIGSVQKPVPTCG